MFVSKIVGEDCAHDIDYNLYDEWQITFDKGCKLKVMP